MPGAPGEAIKKLQHDHDVYENQAQSCREYGTFLNDICKILESENQDAGVLFPWLRHDDHFQSGAKVLCFMPPKMDYYTCGTIIDSWQPQAGKVVAELEVPQKGLAYPDYRIVYDLTDPAILRLEDAIYLRNHLEYFKHWMLPADSKPEWLANNLPQCKF